ncbi:MAG: NUDIX hydrolase [Gammaproteobacteria bacterium]|nr:NUDIX hydrolase [Gammaproteobacteria bacterium]
MIIAIPLHHIPTCSNVGSLALTDEKRQLATQMKNKILANGGYVERQVICTSQIHPQMTKLNYIVSDYATISMLRAESAPIAALGSGTLLCCPERQQILLQRRSSNTTLYPNKLSSFGGHYTPDRENYGFGALLDTLIEEVKEEAGINLLDLTIDVVNDLPPIFMILETNTGGVQFTPLAFALTPEQADQVKGCEEEGHIETFHLVNDLEYLLDESNWAQMGYSCFQTWRELGFPVQKNWNGKLFS